MKSGHSTGATRRRRTLGVFTPRVDSAHDVKSLCDGVLGPVDLGSNIVGHAPLRNDRIRVSADKYDFVFVELPFQIYLDRKIYEFVQFTFETLRPPVGVVALGKVMFLPQSVELESLKIRILGNL